MTRVYNFSAGPGTIPENVLQQVQAELLDWRGIGYSVMEMSHRSKEFIAIAEEITQDVKKLLQVPDNYAILFMPGGGRGQFAAVPMNLLGGAAEGGYAVTGSWSRLAAQEAERYCKIWRVTDESSNGFTTLTPVNEWKLHSRLPYIHYTENETIHGVEFHDIPAVGDIPLICDMSSNILSKPVDISRFGLLYACAQKNMGPAGITLVIVRKDLLNKALPATPTVLHYKSFAENENMPHTPPTFNWYVLGLVVKWVMAQGGLETMAKLAERKSQKLYQVIDQSKLYVNDVTPLYRSRMNVVFHLRDAQLTDRFVEEAKKVGLANLKGHREVGGIRASIYNAMPEAGVDALVEFMKNFESTV
ncbi:MAG TPA: 3-phosphoserine/phosphohydroxythreonine transaminase [Coxiellaceae bacterium]|nr:3-phosphoserine/phosphohydroxythreonine transaminase [Coxiellaceae bacterium]